jgi:hypothetical protein
MPSSSRMARLNPTVLWRQIVAHNKEDSAYWVLCYDDQLDVVFVNATDWKSAFADTLTPVVTFDYILKRPFTAVKIPDAMFERRMPTRVM